MNLADTSKQYFYTKTRNYRIFFAALRTGSRYALALSGATAAYVLMDESIGYARERFLGYRAEEGAVVDDPLSGDSTRGGSGGVREAVPWRSEKSLDRSGVEIPRRVGWREGGVSLWDGGLAGGIMGLGVGTICKSSPSFSWARSFRFHLSPILGDHDERLWQT